MSQHVARVCLVIDLIILHATIGFKSRSDHCCYCFYLRIRPGEEIVRTYDQQGASQESDTASKQAPELSKFAHAVVFVVKANDPRLTDGKYKDTLQKIREHFREDGNNNIHQNGSFLS